MSQGLLLVQAADTVSRPQSEPALDRTDRQGLLLSDEARALLGKELEAYNRCIQDRAYSEARKLGADQEVSAACIEAAIRDLRLHSTSLRQQILGAVGGILLGSALSTLTSMLLQGEFPALISVLTIIQGILGGFLFPAPFRK